MSNVVDEKVVGMQFDNQQFEAGQNDLARASAEKIANMRAEAETRQMLETLRYYDERQRAKSGQAASDPKVNF